MKRSLLLWVKMSLLRGESQMRVTGFVHHTHPLNAECCQVSLPTDDGGWEIKEEKSCGQLVLASSRNTAHWRASLVLWVPTSLIRRDQAIVTGLTHCVNPLCSPCSVQLHFPLDEW